MQNSPSQVGFSIESLSLDMMHVMDLGVSQDLVGANFAKSKASRAARRKHDNVMHLRRRMKAYYKGQLLQKSTCMNKISFAQLGTAKLPCLQAKAAETRRLVPLTKQLTTENPRCLGPKGAYLKAACDELCNFYAILKTQERCMSAESIDRVRTAMTRFLTYWKVSGGHMVIKHHYVWHLVERITDHGNPLCYWKYADEGENRVMASVAKTLHGGDSFYITFLQKALLKV
jgi:hypothetical protein